MPTAAIILAVAMVTTGCAPGPSGAPFGPPARHVDIAQLPDLPLHDPPRRADLPTPPDPADPAAVAARHIRDGLETERLDVLDLGAHQTAARDGGRVSVQVIATHRAGPAGQPYTSVYELDLARRPDGSWTVVGSRSLG